MADELLCEVDGAVARLTINRPDQRNSLSGPVMSGLRERLAELKEDDAVRVVVLTGAGDRAFCSGADLGGMRKGASHLEVHQGRGQMADLFRDMWGLGKPVIARVRGYALAGGFGLALACDFVIAADDAQFGTPEVNVGLWPYMITVPLLRAMAPKKVLELMMTGRRVDAAEGERLGFVNWVVPVDKLDEAVDELATDLASKSSAVLRLGKDAFYAVRDQPADEALELLHAMLTVHTGLEDTAEGLAAFIEKRDPQWKGR